MNVLAANFAALGTHLAAATCTVTVGGWHVGSVTYHAEGRCVASLWHPATGERDQLDGQDVASPDVVRAYALARGYLRWYRPGERP